MDDEYFENELSCSSENNPCVDEPEVIQVKDILAKRFDSLHDAYQCYKRYATVVGFGVRRSSNRRLNGEEVMKKFCCSKEGSREMKWLRKSDRIRRPRALTRNGCNAHMRVTLDYSSGKWFVSSFEESHNHDLVSDHQKCFIRSNRNVTEADLAEAKLLRVAGVKTCQVMNVFAHQYGGFGKVGFMPKDLYNNISAECKLEIMDGDAMATFMYFDVKNDAGMDIYYRFTVDDENRLEHLFWCDGMCRYDYVCFGDVLAFDTTYKKNSYNRPLLVFLGVNNHHQTVVFGYALLANETANAFCWALNTLMDAMANKKHVSVITDGDKAMDRAVREIFPEARHRLCVWHLSRNAKTNIKELSFVKHFGTCMLARWTPAEFEVAWQNLIHHYNLHNNEWVKEKYKTKERWAQAYLTGHFFACQRATTRCEGMNSFIKKFIDTKGTLLQFVRALDYGLNKIRYNELDEDYKSRHTTPVLSHPMASIESHASKVYTRNSFYKFQDELKRETVYNCKNGALVDGSNRIYKLERYGRPEKLFTVTYSEIEKTMKCSCLKLESDGIPCRHLINVMKLEHLSCIPDSLIMKRWTMDAKDCSKLANDKIGDPASISVIRSGSLNFECSRLCQFASQYAEAYIEVREEIAQLTSTIEAKYNRSSNGDRRNAEPKRVIDPNVNRSKVNVANKPVGVKPKDGKHRTRLCGNCKLEGHDRRNCPSLHGKVRNKAKNVSPSTVFNNNGSADSSPADDCLHYFDLSEESVERTKKDGDFTFKSPATGNRRFIPDLNNSFDEMLNSI